MVIVKTAVQTCWAILCLDSFKYMYVPHDTGTTLALELESHTSTRVRDIWISETLACAHAGAMYNMVSSSLSMPYLDIVRADETHIAETWLSCQQVGCGCGNTMYPLLFSNPLATIYGVDFSSRAIDLVLNHPEYDASKIHAFVGDVTKDQLTEHIPAGSVDVCTLVFTLSAISPGSMPKVWHPIQAVQRLCLQMDITIKCNILEMCVSEFSCHNIWFFRHLFAFFSVCLGLWTFAMDLCSSCFSVRYMPEYM